jgi:Tfp pilus assembly protein PilE
VDIKVPNKQSGLILVEFMILCAIIFILALVTLAAWGSAKKEARDAKRMTDISQINEALKIFNNENGFFPAQDSSSKPQGIESYLSFWPEAPLPSDGICSKAQNSYYYGQVEAGSDFQLSFCLGQSTKGLAAGFHTINSKEIK